MQNVDLINFNNSTEEFCQAKFILFDNKLRDYLKNISNCDDVYDLLAKCLKYFDYDSERNRATTKDGFKLPTKAEKAIALVFCLLVDIDAKKINFYSFLNQYFFDEDINESLHKFVEKLIVPFKNMVVVLLEGDIDALNSGEATLHNHEENQDEDDALQEEIDDTVSAGLKKEILTACESIDAFATSHSGLDDAHQICQAMIYASKEGNLDLFAALQVGLLNCTKNKKFIKYAKSVLRQLYE